MEEEKDKQQPTESSEDLHKVEEIMGPVPDYPMAGADLQRRETAKDASTKDKAEALLHGHGFRKKPKAPVPAKGKIKVSFGDDAEVNSTPPSPKTETTAKKASKIAIVDADEPQEVSDAITKTDEPTPKDEPKEAIDTPVEAPLIEPTPKKGIVVKDFADEVAAEVTEPASDAKVQDQAVADEAAVAAKIGVKVIEDTDTDRPTSDEPTSAPPLPPAAKPAKPAPRPAAPAAMRDIQPGTPVAPPIKPAAPTPKPLVTPPPPNPRGPVAVPAMRPRPVDGMANPAPAQRAMMPTVGQPIAKSPIERPVAPPPQPVATPAPAVRTPRPAPPPVRPAPTNQAVQTKTTKPPKTGPSVWHRLLRSSSFRWITVSSLLIALLAVGGFPATRYPVLNLFGVRVSASLVVKDDKTSLPLKNVTVAFEAQEIKTDQEGRATFSGLKLGKHAVSIKKIGFETQTKHVVLGWGSNPLGEYAINATGAQYTFVVKDWLGQKPIAKAEVLSGDASAYTDDNGMALLTTDKEIEGKLDITVKAEGYRTETQTIDAQDKAERQQVLVPSQQQYFVSKRSGKYDVYKIDIDGKNESLVVPGTGIETEDIKLIPHPTKPIAAMVASRENARNKDGFLLNGLYIIDFESNDIQKVTQSERIEIISWMNDRLVFAKIAEGASNTNPQRHRLMSYNYDDESTKELATSNYFNDILAVNGYIYYAPSNAFQDNPNAQLTRIKADGSDQISVINKEVWNLFRVGYDEIDALQHQDWYSFKLGETLATKMPAGPANPKHRIYVDAPTGKQSLWIDERDGQGVLLRYDIDKRQDTILYAKTGLTYPVRWLNDEYVVFRVSNSTEIADYVMSINGKDPVKIRDVSNSAYIGRWYYY